MILYNIIKLDLDGPSRCKPNFDHFLYCFLLVFANLPLVGLSLIFVVFSLHTTRFRRRDPDR
ncbi:hypothetical protein SAMN05444412_109102 [Rhodonellum ikkaensis]|uniref:Uncharacterized protein n=1 Tax=Rhodonellum ikkaensis TaxID=336829 RepID=A0A1H3RTB4_9BACT|nr:hypothetical protein SAMN05444412_109102 [Rhodonellum ikkaensis]